jgi:hypothetical protein
MVATGRRLGRLRGRSALADCLAALQRRFRSRRRALRALHETDARESTHDFARRCPRLLPGFERLCQHPLGLAEGLEQFVGRRQLIEERDARRLFLKLAQPGRRGIGRIGGLGAGGHTSGEIVDQCGRRREGEAQEEKQCGAAHQTEKPAISRLSVIRN